MGGRCEQFEISNQTNKEYTLNIDADLDLIIHCYINNTNNKCCQCGTCWNVGMMAHLAIVKPWCSDDFFVLQNNCKSSMGRLIIVPLPCIHIIIRELMLLPLQ